MCACGGLRRSRGWRQHGGAHRSAVARCCGCMWQHNWDVPPGAFDARLVGLLSRPRLEHVWQNCSRDSLGEAGVTLRCVRTVPPFFLVHRRSMLLRTLVVSTLAVSHIRSSAGPNYTIRTMQSLRSVRESASCCLLSESLSAGSILDSQGCASSGLSRR